MDKLAVFVEGQTEQIFTARLIEKIAGEKNVCIVKHEVRGGQNPNYRILEALAAPEGRKYFVLIVDCVGDNRVKSKITDNYQSLVSNGYQAIIGIRDVYPDVAYHDIAKLRRGFDYKVKTKPIQVVFILGVMEIETWFITEHTHFQKMDARLTMARIRGALGFDPSVDDIQLRPKPSDDLHSIYQLAGMAYTKSKARVQRTVDKLDYERIYLELGDKLPDLLNFVNAIDNFLS